MFSYTPKDSLANFKEKPLTKIQAFKDKSYHDLLRLMKITGLTEKHIGKSIMVCPYCSFQLPEPNSFIFKRCPECYRSLTKVTITADLLLLIKEQRQLQLSKS